MPDSVEHPEQGKLDALFTVRIPTGTKSMVDKLDPTWKAKMHYDVRTTIAKVLHEAGFDRNLYLGE